MSEIITSERQHRLPGQRVWSVEQYYGGTDRISEWKWAAALSVSARGYIQSTATVWLERVQGL